MTDTPENNPISNDQIDPNHSKPLDVHTWSDHPKINELVDELWFQVVETALGGKSNNKGKSNPKRQLKVLLLDLYVAWLDDPNLCIGVNGTATLTRLIQGIMPYTFHVKLYH